MGGALTFLDGLHEDGVVPADRQPEAVLIPLDHHTPLHQAWGHRGSTGRATQRDTSQASVQNLILPDNHTVLKGTGTTQHRENIEERQEQGSSPEMERDVKTGQAYCSSYTKQRCRQLWHIRHNLREKQLLKKSSSTHTNEQDFFCLH